MYYAIHNTGADVKPACLLGCVLLAAGESRLVARPPVFHTMEKIGVIFHTMENILGGFPHNGKLVPGIPAAILRGGNYGGGGANGAMTR